MGRSCNMSCSQIKIDLHLCYISRNTGESVQARNFTSQDFNTKTWDQGSLFLQFYLRKCRSIRAKKKISPIIGYLAFQYSRYTLSFYTAPTEKHVTNDVITVNCNINITYHSHPQPLPPLVAATPLLISVPLMKGKLNLRKSQESVSWVHLTMKKKVVRNSESSYTCRKFIQSTRG